jgi:hypothetical protein
VKEEDKSQGILQPIFVWKVIFFQPPFLSSVFHFAETQAGLFLRVPLLFSS